jgi:ubiquinone/menaquinone biosynthesis C-methylase UbiE
MSQPLIIENPVLGVPSGDIINKTKSLGIRLRCPSCKSDIQEWDCFECGFHLLRDRGVVHALPLARLMHYARFIEDYERIRAAEGRGSESDDFYLNLPYRDVSGRNDNQWKIRACSYEYMIKRLLRPAVAKGGRILDLGAGNCWMSFRLAIAGYDPFAVDLLTNNRDGLGAAEHYRSYLSGIFPRFQAELSCLPFQSGQFDAVVFNASFHYAEDYQAALCEALRCTKNGGMVIISDTPWYSSEKSGKQMVSARRAAFIQQYETASDSISSLEYLTNERLQDLEKHLSIKWTIHTPQYGFQWTMRPLIAKLRNRREPSQFHIYAAKKDSI